MTPCTECELAMAQPRVNTFTSGCDCCKARALAAIGAHEESRQAGHITAQYRAALGTLFGEQWAEGDESVKEWAARIRQAKASIGCI